MGESERSGSDEDRDRATAVAGSGKDDDARDHPSSRSSSREQRKHSKRHKSSNHHDKKKKKKKKRSKHSRRDDKYTSSDSSSDSSSEDERRERKRKKKRRDFSNYSSDEEQRHRKKKKSKKRKRDRSDKHDDHDDDDDDVPSGAASFGKYGIIKASDFYKKQRSFEVWMAEVKGIQSFNGPKWELQNYFAEYCEDYNTATLPHIKYYDFDDWEMKEYRKQTAEQSKKQQHSGVLADEARHQAEMRQKAKEKRQAEMELLRATMNTEKIQDMKHRAELQNQMAHAFKTGDQETVKRIQKKLEPEAR